MATIRKVGERWRVEVRKRGVSASENVRTKAEATRWAAEREAEIEIEDGRVGKVPIPFIDKPLVDITSDEWPTWRDTLAAGSDDRKPLAPETVMLAGEIFGLRASNVDDKIHTLGHSRSRGLHLICSIRRLLVATVAGATAALAACGG